jgi:hypothetical protein
MSLVEYLFQFFFGGEGCGIQRYGGPSNPNLSGFRWIQVWEWVMGWMVAVWSGWGGVGDGHTFRVS